MPTLAEQLDAELQDLERSARIRALPELAGSDRVSIASPFGPLLSFCSNDYLGLASHPALAAAAARAALDSGSGAGASRLVSGDLPQHRALEAALACHVHQPAALLFPTGYQANIGLITSLAGPEDVIVSDAANHASIIDGCRLTRARVAIYPHLDLSAAQRHLEAAHGHRRRFLVTESLFSMDGDAAPLADLADLARRHGAALLVDEAHALGVLGPHGAGLCAAAGILPDALVGTLGKAFGSHGGFVAGSPTLRRYLVNRARTFIFTTAPPPPTAAAALAALELVRAPEGDDRRRQLHLNIALLAETLGRGAPPTPSPILPVVLGPDAAALSASQALRADGLFVQAIRPPTVPPGTARLRVTLSAAHTPEQVLRLAAALRPHLRS